MQARRDLEDVLGGYAKANPGEMAKLSQRTDWKQLAVWEESRRAAKLLELFDDHTISAIASGDLDLQALCQQAVASQKASK